MNPISFEVAYQPRYPTDYNPGIGIIGCGGIVKHAHLPAYMKHNLNLAGVYDINPEATAYATEKFGIKRVFADLDEMLASPEIEIVDIATQPDQRLALIRKAVAAGKHVLAQKPLALDVDEARAVVEEAEKAGIKVAVNQNGRWAPPWRIATLLIEQGAIGEVCAVTHIYDMRFGWIPGSFYDTVPHLAIYDYSVHWIDITRCWLGGKTIKRVRARDYRVPNQPESSKAEWGMWIETEYEDGSNGMIRGSACTYEASNKLGHPFIIQGTEGTIRGCALDHDYVELETAAGTVRYNLEGRWFPDGFAGTMGELQCAIAEGREPFNSARHNLLSLQITLAACRSAEQDGIPIAIESMS